MNALLARELSIERFEASNVDPDSSDHESHVYVAWLYDKLVGAQH